MTNMDFYIGGDWHQPNTDQRHEVHDPSTEEPFTTIAWADDEEVDRAVGSARQAFETWSTTDRSERLAALRRLAAEYEQRLDDMASVISQEMGAPLALARSDQAPAGLYHLNGFIKALEQLDLERPLRPNRADQRIMLEPMGVAALITPWNWPMNQVTLKVGAAIAAGCTMVLKPSEIAPVSAALFSEIVHAAELPRGVYNLVHGDGAGTGAALTAHPEIDVISFTGSTRAGTAISKAAADGVKRVSLELGGKSPNLVFADADIDEVVPAGASFCFENTGQSCNAPTRMLVERSAYDRAVELARVTAEATSVGPAGDEGDHIGPLVSEAQFTKVQKLIDSAIAQGARLVAGGPGRPDGFDRGWFVRPTVFADVTPDMTIWTDEVFGPVLAMSAFDTDDQAIEMANDTPYGLAAYVQSTNPERLRHLARRLRAGMVRLNGTDIASGAPFGGYKQSGIGREGGVWGIEEFLEVKAVSGWPG